MEIEITTKNVQELWELYENYLYDYKKDIETLDDIKNMPYFEDFVSSEVTKCEQCGEYRTLEEMGDSELALQDHICQYCMEDGYGC